MMKTWNKSLALLMLVPFSIPAIAQDEGDELDKRMLEAEQRLTEEEKREMQRAAEVLAREAEELVRAQELQGEDVDVRMREAERRMAEAAQQMAELSMRQLPQIERIERVIRASRGPALGVTIGADSEGRPVEGVEVLGVTPGGAAEEAGLRAGDVITSINGESFSADNSNRATEKLIEFMQGVEEGDELEVEYLRDGNTATVALSPRPMENNVFAFSFGEDGMKMPGQDFDVHIAPGANKFNSFVWAMHDDGFGDMEMVKLTERLGSYFGSDEGLLVVRAPGNKDLKLEDGDVILNIDGRTPNSVSHAMRILGSYQAGEELKIEIMRDKKKRTIEIAMPDNRQSSVAPKAPLVAPRAQRAPLVAPPPAGLERT